MPTNLPAEYYEVEERYKAAESPAERVRLLEELISTVPKHKGTDKLRAEMRRRLSKMKSSAQAKSSVSRHESSYHIDKEGAGQVVIIGAANSGKSALVTALTNANLEVAPYPYTTRLPAPGMMVFNNVPIQLIDTPPLDQDYLEPELFDLIRRADIVLLLLDLQTYPDEQFHNCMAVLSEHGIAPRRLKGQIDADGRLIYVTFMIVANKSDDADSDELFFIFCELLEEDWACLPISATTGRHLERLQLTIYDKLNIIRVYSKPPGREADISAPFVLKKGSTVEEFAGKVHKDFVNNLKASRVWGSTAFEGQMVGRDYELADGDVIELRI